MQTLRKMIIIINRNRRSLDMQDLSAGSLSVKFPEICEKAFPNK